jgi:hypothetical protein
VRLAEGAKALARHQAFATNVKNQARNTQAQYCYLQQSPDEHHRAPARSRRSPQKKPSPKKGRNGSSSSDYRPPAKRPRPEDGSPFGDLFTVIPPPSRSPKQGGEETPVVIRSQGSE